MSAKLIIKFNDRRNGVECARSREGVLPSHLFIAPAAIISWILKEVPTPKDLSDQMAALEKEFVAVAGMMNKHEKEHGMKRVKNES